MADPRPRPSPLQNRVTATGEIVADPSRGLMMGNRGSIHTLERRLGVTRWRSKLWICCVIEFRGARREPMPPGRWTSLFFLDEVTALAAGHRPCAYCRRADYLAYAHAWQAGHGLPERPRAVAMDAVLHGQRVRPYTREQVTWPATAGELPDGVVVRPEGGTAGLLAAGALRPWSLTGYGPAVPVPAGLAVRVLTPPASTAELAAGYRPWVHPSAGPAGAPVPAGLRSL